MLSVVLFHINPDWLPGGFVGVDVFFVNSGFVIAYSVMHVRMDRFRDYFLWFYRRRFLRILPAIYLYVLVVGALGVLFLLTTEATKYIEVTGVASLFGSSNFALLRKAGDYFSAASEYNSFTHTWSLAVEEEYYFLFPVFPYAMVVKRDARVSTRWLMGGVVAVACVASRRWSHRGGSRGPGRPSPSTCYRRGCGSWGSANCCTPQVGGWKAGSTDAARARGSPRRWRWRCWRRASCGRLPIAPRSPARWCRAWRRWR